jgi:hypothetical protein
MLCNEVQKYGYAKEWPYCDSAVNFRPRILCQPNNLVTHVWNSRKHSAVDRCDVMWSMSQLIVLLFLCRKMR